MASLYAVFLSRLHHTKERIEEEIPNKERHIGAITE